MRPPALQHVRALLDAQVQCVLATANGAGWPSTHLMAYAFAEDLRQVYMASGVSSRKIEDIRSNSAVSLLWDNRTGNLADHGDGMSLE